MYIHIICITLYHICLYTMVMHFLKEYLAEMIPGRDGSLASIFGFTCQRIGNKLSVPLLFSFSPELWHCIASLAPCFTRTLEIGSHLFVAMSGARGLLRSFWIDQGWRHGGLQAPQGDWVEERLGRLRFIARVGAFGGMRRWRNKNTRDVFELKVTSEFGFPF